MTVSITRFITVLCALLLVAACTAPAPQPTAVPGQPSATAPAPAAPAPGSTDTPRIGTPEPASGDVVVDRSCKTDADCTVKDVGNCCGYYPACVNVDSPTDPQGVKARCSKEGMMGVCGFPAIDSCSCVKGECAASGNSLEAPFLEES